VKEKHITKIPNTGHYLYKGKAVDVYNRITSEMDTLILTSGVRGVVKQASLFLNKIVETKGNISMASRSIAPIGYSFHGVGDFDVGIKGWGHNNFTDKFATTSEYSRLMEGGYMRIRYDRKNPYGVRFEPWHVKVV
jgi:D-alanyl-D-alanine carboxypeptidase